MRAWRWLAACLALCAGAVAAAPAAFDDALNATLLGERPAGAYFLVEVLAAQGQGERAEHLRLALWRRQFERLRGGAAQPRQTVAQLIDEGARLVGEPIDFTGAWEHAYNTSVRLSWPDEPAPDERLRITLTSRAPDPLPLIELRLRFGSEAHGVTLACATDPPAADVHAAYRQTLTPDRAVTLLCKPPADAGSRSRLPVLLAAARQGGEPPWLLPRGLSTRRHPPDRWLWALWAHVEDPAATWLRRAKQAQLPENAGRTWQPAAWPDPPQLQPLPPTLAQRAAAHSRHAGERLLPLLYLGGSAWVLFFAVRLTLRRAALPVQTTVCLVAGVGLALLYLVVTRGRSHFGGDGWGAWGELGVWLFGLSVGLGSAVLAGLMLKLHRLLDHEGRTWGQTIVDGWRRALQLGGATSAGQFWGFVAFFAWTWGLISPWGRPWSQWGLATLLLPLISLSVRRLRSLTVKEFVTLLAVCAVLAAELWL